MKTIVLLLIGCLLANSIIVLEACDCTCSILELAILFDASSSTGNNPLNFEPIFSFIKVKLLLVSLKFQSLA